MGLSQVSVSEHIRALEERLGVPLFIRSPGAAPVMTEHGHMALWHAERALESVSDLVSAVSPAPDGRVLRMVLHSFLMGDLRLVLDRFGDEHPDMSLAIDTAAYLPLALAERIAERSLDLALFFTAAGAAPTGSRYIRDEPLSFFVGLDHPLAAKSSASIADLASEKIVRLANPLGDIVAQALEAVGIRSPRVAVSTDDFGLLVHSLREGVGYACMFKATSETCRSMGLVELEIDAILPALQVHLLIRPRYVRDRIVLELVDRMADAWTARNNRKAA